MIFLFIFLPFFGFSKSKNMYQQAQYKIKSFYFSLIALYSFIFSLLASLSRGEGRLSCRLKKLSLSLTLTLKNTSPCFRVSLSVANSFLSYLKSDFLPPTMYNSFPGGSTGGDNVGNIGGSTSTDDQNQVTFTLKSKASALCGGFVLYARNINIMQRVAGVIFFKKSVDKFCWFAELLYLCTRKRETRAPSRGFGRLGSMKKKFFDIIPQTEIVVQEKTSTNRHSIKNGNES